MGVIRGALITGGCGFIGSHLAEYFIQQRIPCVCVDDFSTGFAGNADFLRSKADASIFKIIEADVCAPWNAWESDVPANFPISHVFHFASPASPKDFDRLGAKILWVNSVGLNNALEFASRHDARVVFASSSEVYGHRPEKIFSEDMPGLVNSFGARASYDEGKRFGEALIREFNLRNGTRHGIVRIFNTYGPRMNPQDGRVIIEFLKCAWQGEPLPLEGGGLQSRSFCYVTDLVRQVISYAETQINTPMNIGCEREIDMQALIAEIRSIGFSSLRVEERPGKPDDPTHRCPDLTKIKNLMGSSYKVTSLEYGLKQTLLWLSDLSIDEQNQTDHSSSSIVYA